MRLTTTFELDERTVLISTVHPFSWHCVQGKGHSGSVWLSESTCAVGINSFLLPVFSAGFGAFTAGNGAHRIDCSGNQDLPCTYLAHMSWKALIFIFLLFMVLRGKCTGAAVGSRW